MPESASSPRRSSPPWPFSSHGRSGRPPRWLSAAVLAAGFVAGGGGTGTATAALAASPLASVTERSARTEPAAPQPAVPSGLPEDLEAAAPYVRQVSCDPVAKPGAVALGKLLVDTYPGTGYGIARPCGSDGTASEHYEGRAVDWTVSVRDPEDSARASALIDWLLATDDAGHGFANARRLGVMYLIWNDRIWGSYASAAGWRPYSTCATHPEPGWDTTCHRNHLHISLSWAGAAGRTSFWTRRVAATDYGPCRPADLNWATPRSGANPSHCPAFPAVSAPAGSTARLAALVRFSGAVIGQGSTGPVVSAVQAALGITADGRYGASTANAVSDFRRAQNLPGGSGMDAATWRALLKSARAAATSTPTAPGSGRAADSGGSRSTSETAPSELARYRNLVLSYGSTGPAVSAVQRALRVTPVSGWFGPVTRSAVVALQKSTRLPATGVVDAATWRALGA